MPDASRLVAAVCLAVVAYFLSGIVMGIFEAHIETPGYNFGWFVQVNIVIGIFVGWVSMGPRAGRGVSNAVTNGITGVFLLVLLGLFVQSCNEMVKLAMKNRYDGAFEAIGAVFEIGAEWGLLLLTVPVGIILAAGAIISGLLTEYAWRTWR